MRALALVLILAILSPIAASAHGGGGGFHVGVGVGVGFGFRGGFGGRGCYGWYGYPYYPYYYCGPSPFPVYNQAGGYAYQQPQQVVVQQAPAPVVNVYVVQPSAAYMQECAEQAERNRQIDADIARREAIAGHEIIP